MVATDTVVGIVGAVVLASVMVGVFFYEYNNTPVVANTQIEGPKLASFQSLYKALNAGGDIDHDGIKNFLDADMDGNGVADANQTTNLATVTAYSGSINPPSPPATTSTTEIAFTVEEGNEGMSVAFFYNTTTPVTPLPIPRSPTLEFKVVNANGDTVLQSAAPTQTGTAVASEANTMEAQPAGAYRLIVTETFAGPATTFGGHITLDFGAVHKETVAVGK